MNRLANSPHRPSRVSRSFSGALTASDNSSYQLRGYPVLDRTHLYRGNLRIGWEGLTLHRCISTLPDPYLRSSSFSSPPVKVLSNRVSAEHSGQVIGSIHLIKLSLNHRTRLRARISSCSSWKEKLPCSGLLEMSRTDSGICALALDCNMIERDLA
jgi:hypothetical protein